MAKTEEKEQATNDAQEDVKEEALSVLSQLQYKRKEAEGMVEKAIQRNPNIKTSEELLNEVYMQKTKG